MELEDIKINPDNHEDYDIVVDHWGRDANDCLAIHNTVTEYFEEKLIKRHDWGGRYASFLQDIGISFQSDNGWWSIAAVDPENIQTFVDYNLEDVDGEPINRELIDNYNFAKANFKYLKENKKITQKYTVLETIDEILKHKDMISGYQLNLL